MKFKVTLLFLSILLLGGCSSGDYWTVGGLPPRKQLDPGVLTVTVDSENSIRVLVVVRVEGALNLNGAKTVGIWYRYKSGDDPISLTYGSRETHRFEGGDKEYKFWIYGLYPPDEVYGVWAFMEYEDKSRVTGDVAYFSPSEFPRPVPEKPRCEIGEDGKLVTLFSSFPLKMTGIKERGFCVTVSDAQPDKDTPRIAVEGTGDEFSLTLDTLRRGILYYVWPYVADVSGLRFGKSATVRIPAPELVPEVRTMDGATVDVRWVTARGVVTDAKGAVVEKAGIERRGLEADFDDDVSGWSGVKPEADGTFSVSSTVSRPGRWYYRAFATTAYGTGFGEIMTVDVPDFTQYLPVVTTDARPVKNTAATVTVSGRVESDGGMKITERGFCGSTFSDPKDNSSPVKVSGTTGKMTATIEGVPMDKTYYYRAYAKNEAGTAYGEVRSVYIRSSDYEVSFRDLKATVNSDGSVTFGVRIWDDRRQKFKERGFCWEYASYSAPTVSDSKDKTWSSYGSSYEVKVSAYKFSKGREYRVRAYVITDDGVVWYSDKYEKVLFTVPEK